MSLELEYISVLFVGLNQNHDQYAAFDAAAHPDPSTGLLLGFGLMGLAGARRRN